MGNTFQKSQVILSENAQKPPEEPKKVSVEPLTDDQKDDQKDDVPLKYKKKPIPKSLRDKVWKNYFEESMKGVCLCGKDIFYNENYECGHKIAEFKGGKTLEENLQPICRSCNRSMRTRSITEYFSQFSSINIMDKIFCEENQKKDIEVTIGKNKNLQNLINKFYVSFSAIQKNVGNIENDQNIEFSEKYQGKIPVFLYSNENICVAGYTIKILP